jgi:hypothetical protein
MHTGAFLIACHSVCNIDPLSRGSASKTLNADDGEDSQENNDRELEQKRGRS